MGQGARLAGVAAVVAAAMLWGLTGTMQAVMPEGRDPLAVGALRLAIGAAALQALAWAGPRKASPRLPTRAVLFAGAAMAGYNLFFFFAVLMAGVGVGTAVAIGSAPIWVTIWTIVRHRTLPGAFGLASKAVALTGLALLFLDGGGRAGSVAGLALAAGAGASYAAYSLVTSRHAGDHPPVALAAATFTAAAALCLPLLLVSDLGWLAEPAAWGPLAVLGFGSTGLAYALYTWGLGRVAAATAVTLALAEPVTAWALATFALGEPVTVARAVGVALILTGLVLVAAYPERD